MDEAVFHFDPKKTLFSGVFRNVYGEVFYWGRPKKFSNIQKPHRKIAVDDINVMFFPYNFPADEANFPRHPSEKKQKF